MQFGNRLLFPLMVAAALSVILFGVFGVAALLGHLPSFGTSQSQADKPQAPSVVAAVNSVPDFELLNATRTIDIANREVTSALTCKDCGVIESVESAARQQSGVGATLIKATDSNGQHNDSNSAGFLLRVRMDDGALRVLQEQSDPDLQLGQRVRVINGIIRPQR